MTPSQEYELGQAMLAHEKTIDRSYLKDRTSNLWWEQSKPYPNCTDDNRAVVEDIYNMGEDAVFRTKDINVDQSYEKLRRVINRLLLCNGLSQLKSKTGFYYQYKTSAPNRTVLEEILYDG